MYQLLTWLSVQKQENIQQFYITGHHCMTCTYFKIIWPIPVSSSYVPNITICYIRPFDLLLFDWFLTSPFPMRYLGVLYPNPTPSFVWLLKMSRDTLVDLLPLPCIIWRNIQESPFECNLLFLWTLKETSNPRIWRHL